ncbi:MAG TPA: urease accessory protein UreD [Acidimicrobiales bacterium]|nr:urease accessory protein UreD [Acidimicrobiales bacterium]
MQGCAELVVGPGSAVERLVDAPPVAFRPTAEGVYLVGTAASPVGGDDVRIEIRARSGGDLKVRSSAASVAYAGGSSRWTVHAVAGPASRLSWRPEPLIVTAGADHDQRTMLDCASDATVEWADLTLLGRHGEPPGRARLRLDADVDGRPLLRHELSVGSGAAGWDGPAVLGPARAVATVLAVTPEPRPPGRAAGEGWAWLELEGPGRLLVAVALDLPELERMLCEAGVPRRRAPA